MLKYFFTCLLFSFFLSSFAQTNKLVDSLLKAIDTETTDSNRLKLYTRIGEVYMDNNADKAIEYFLKSLEISKKINRTISIGNNYYSMGFCYLVKGDFEKSLDNYLQSARIYEQLKDNRRLTNAYFSIGNLYGQQKDFKKTNEYYDKAEVLIKSTKDSSQMCTLFAERGIVSDQQGNFDEALASFKKANDISVALDDQYMITNTLINIGLTYKHQKKTKEALEHFEAARLKFTTSNAPSDNFAVLYNNIGATHSQAGNFAKAKEAFDKSIEFAQQSGSRGVEMENYHNMSDMFGKMKDFEKQAYYLTRYYNLKDSLFNLDNSNKLTQLESDYQLEKKNIEIVKQNAEVNTQKNQRNIFIVISVATLLLLTTLGVFYKRIKNNNILLQEKNHQINKQKDELQKLNHVKDRLFSIISHDLRNPLVTLKSYLSLAENSSISEEKKLKFKTQTVNAVAQTSNMLDNLLAWANMQIKNTAGTIVPVNIKDCISDVVNDVHAQAIQKQLQIHQNIQTEIVPGDNAILSIAIRNLLTNAVKYSQPEKNIYISCLQKDKHILISIKDEGIGLSKSQIEDIMSNQNNSTSGTNGEKGSGLGLFLVKELLEKMNAALLIESKEGEGSTFTIRLTAF